MVVGKPYIHFKVNNEPIEEVVDYNYTWATTVETNKGPINTPVYIENAAQAKSIFNVDMNPYFAQNPQSLIMVRVAAGTEQNTPSQGVFNFNLAEDIIIFRADHAQLTLNYKGDDGKDVFYDVPLYYVTEEVEGNLSYVPLIPHRDENGKLIPESYISGWDEKGHYIKPDTDNGIIGSKVYDASVVSKFLIPQKYILPVTRTVKDEDGQATIEKTALFRIKSQYAGDYNVTVSCYKAKNQPANITTPGYTIAITNPDLGTLRIANGYDVHKIVNRINDRDFDIIAETTDAGDALYNVMHSYPQPATTKTVTISLGKPATGEEKTIEKELIISTCNEGTYLAKAYEVENGVLTDKVGILSEKNYNIINEQKTTEAGYEAIIASPINYEINLEVVGNANLVGGNNGEWDSKKGRIPTQYQADAHKDGLNILRRLRLAGIFCMYGEEAIQREYVEHGINSVEPEKGMNNNETCKWRTILLGANEDDRSDLSTLAAKAASLDNEYTLFLGQGLIDTGVNGLASNLTVKEKQNYGLVGDHHLLPYECTQYIAGLRSKLNYGESIFGGQGRKRIRSVGDLEIAPLLDYDTEYTWEPNYYTRLNEAGVLTFTEEYGNITLLDGVTTVQSGEEEDEEGVMNILKYCQNGVYDVCLPYIGRNINADLENSLITSIETFLEEMKSVDQTLIDTEEYSAYDVSVSLNSRKNQLLGRIYVYLVICPVHAIRQIEVEMTVQ